MGSSGPAIDAGLLRVLRIRTGAPADAIGRAFESSASFRSLCSDVRACERALRKFEGTGGDEAAERAVEYARLLEELVEEVREALEPGPDRQLDGSAPEPDRAVAGFPPGISRKENAEGVRTPTRRGDST